MLYEDVILRCANEEFVWLNLNVHRLTGSTGCCGIFVMVDSFRYLKFFLSNFVNILKLRPYCYLNELTAVESPLWCYTFRYLSILSCLGKVVYFYGGNFLSNVGTRHFIFSHQMLQTWFLLGFKPLSLHFTILYKNIQLYPMWCLTSTLSP